MKIKKKNKRKIPAASKGVPSRYKIPKPSPRPSLKGNAFWEQRSKHGRDMLFASPELMWEAAMEYFRWCDDNPIMIAEVGKGGTWVRDEDSEEEDVPKPDIIEVPKARPYTMQGLCLFMDASSSYFKVFKHTQRGKEKAEGFLTVIDKIEEIVYNNQMTGATCGYYNANIIARVLGLTEKTQSEVIQVNITPTPDEVKKIGKALNARI